MAKKIVAVVGEYVNAQNEQKAEFCEIGVVNVSQGGKEYALIDPTVNLAGVLLKQNALAAKRGEQPRDMVMCSVMERQNGGAQGGGYGQQAPQQSHSQPQGRPNNQAAPSSYGYGNVQHARQPQQPQQNYQNQQTPNRSQPAPAGDSFDDD